jgi:amino acid permease
MKSIKKFKIKLINTENVIIIILVIFIILITAIGMIVKHYKPDLNDKPENKHESVF